jgi:DNA invertase Pin-like site-specific DNA recombinase
MRPLARPGLSYAIDRLQASAASRLVVPKLDHLASSMEELQVVLGWFERAEIPITSLDEELDSDTPEGQATIRAVLAAPTEAKEAGVGAGEGMGLAAGTSAGRPMDRDELTRRIQGMRAEGMSLQAIADALNDEHVPTTRGGREWRRSSVHSLLGYRGPTPTGGEAT